MAAKPKPPTADGTFVYCAHDEIVPLGKVHPNPRNPNIHTDEQVRLLAKIISAHGWRAPITVSRRSKMIVRGHARREAALLLGLATVPVDYQDYGSDEEELADLVADNRIAELAAMGIDETRAIMDDLKRSGMDLELTGYNEVEVRRMWPDEDPGLPDKLPEPEIEGEYDEAIRVILVFETDEQRQALARLLNIEMAEGRVVYEWKRILNKEYGDGPYAND